MSCDHARSRSVGVGAVCTSRSVTFCMRRRTYPRGPNSRHVQQTQERLKRPILIENPSTYLQFEHSSIPEWEFLGAVVRSTGCGILCDLNNIFVSASSHGWDPLTYLDALPAMPCVHSMTRAWCASTITARASPHRCGAV